MNHIPRYYSPVALGRQYESSDMSMAQADDPNPPPEYPQSMLRLWNEDPSKALKIFLDVIVGEEFEVWYALKSFQSCGKLFERMEQKAKEGT